jgi:FtsH-binding integral membrane protein
MGLTLVACIAISAYAMVTKTDFTLWGAGLCMAILVLAVVSLLALFLPSNYAKPIEIGISGLMILLMGVFIIYDL